MTTDRSIRRMTASAAALNRTLAAALGPLPGGPDECACEGVIPCPRWSMEEPHPAHDWDAPVDGPSRCPGRPDGIREFPIADILSVTTGRLMSRARPPILGVAELVSHITGAMTVAGGHLDPVALQAADAHATSELRRQYPWLGDVEAPSGDNADLYAWLIEQEREHGETLLVAPASATA